MKGHPRTIEVHVSGFDLGCCVPPPGVGDEVCWSLIFLSPPWPGHPLVGDDDWVRTGRWRVERSGAGVLVVDDAVAARWAAHGGPPPDPGAAELTGILAAVFHGGLGGAAEGPPPVRGIVRRVRVTSQLQQIREGQAGLVDWVPGSRWCYDVARCPDLLDMQLPDHDTPRRRTETGVLVDLAV